MATPKELIVELKQANDSYHKALNLILSSDGIDVAVKVRVGAYANNLFQLMNEINVYLERELLPIVDIIESIPPIPSIQVGY